MHSPFFTVIIPTFNRAELLQSAVASVLDQTFKDFELIVVDDFSADHAAGTASLKPDTRIRYIANDHKQGVAGARNAGIFRANGEWIAFLDDDDTWLPNKLELLYNKIREADSSAGLIYTGYALYDFEKNRELAVLIPAKEGWRQKDLLYKNFIGTFSAVAIRSDLLKKVGGCDERFHYFEDCDLYVRIAGLSTIACLKETLTHYRVSNSDRLGFKYEKRLHAYRLFWEKHKEMINRSLRLRHRAASRVFELAVMQGKMEEFFKTLPWMLAGVFFDVPNIIRVLREIASSIYRDKLHVKTG